MYGYEFWNYTCLTLLTLFSVYFLSNELKQLFENGFEYLLSMWNYIDFVPPILIILLVLKDIFNADSVIN